MNTYFIVCFKWIKNNTGMNIWQKYLKDSCIVKVSAESISAAFNAVKAAGYYTDGNSYAETLPSYIRAYQRYLDEGTAGYYDITSTEQVSAA